MKPMPGSCTSRAMSCDSSSRMASPTLSGRLPTPLCRRRHPLDDKRFDDVADLDVVVLFEADAALEPRLHLGDVVLEAAERADLAFVDDHVVAEQARLRVAGSRDAAVGHHAARDRAELRHLERLA